MEENRLKPMIEGYDQKLFKEYYEKTAALRKKLASEIDHKRFGVDQAEIESWFTVKFIYVFNHYYETKKETLLGHLIKAMQLFKYRVLRKAYTKEFSQSIISLDEVDYQNLDPEDPRENKELFKDLALSFMEKHLSENALDLLKIQLQPPPYILTQMQELEIKDLNKIPSSIIAEYYGLGNSNKGIRYIDRLRKEIKEATEMARSHFRKASIRLDSNLC